MIKQFRYLLKIVIKILKRIVYLLLYLRNSVKKIQSDDGIVSSLDSIAEICVIDDETWRDGREEFGPNIFYKAAHPRAFILVLFTYCKWSLGKTIQTAYRENSVSGIAPA